MPKTLQHPEILVQARRGADRREPAPRLRRARRPGRRDRRALGRPGHGDLLALVGQAAAGAGVARRRDHRALRLGRRGARHHERLARGPGLPGRTSCGACSPTSGLTEQDLRCDGALKARHNCSGNHTGFLAACVHHGWDVPSYQQPEHPAQQAALAAFAALTGLDAGDGRDRRRRLRHRELRHSGHRRRRHLRPAPRAAARRSAPRCARTRSSSRGRAWIDTEVMRALPGATSKCGAEGLSCFSLPDGRGLAVKVDRRRRPRPRAGGPGRARGGRSAPTP